MVVPAKVVVGLIVSAWVWTLSGMVGGVVGSVVGERVVGVLGGGVFGWVGVVGGVGKRSVGSGGRMEDWWKKKKKLKN